MGRGGDANSLSPALPPSSYDQRLPPLVCAPRRPPGRLKCSHGAKRPAGGPAVGGQVRSRLPPLGHPPVGWRARRWSWGARRGAARHPRAAAASPRPPTRRRRLAGQLATAAQPALPFLLQAAVSTGAFTAGLAAAQVCGGVGGARGRRPGSQASAPSRPLPASVASTAPPCRARAWCCASRAPPPSLGP